MTFTSADDMIPQVPSLPERIETVKYLSTSETPIEVVVPHLSTEAEACETSSWTAETILEIGFLIRKNSQLM